MPLKQFLYDIAETVFSSVAVLLVLYMTIALPEMVWGSSMEPNFYTNERILVERVTKYFKPYQRGEIVVFVPEGESRHLIKRIVGVPGDVFKIFNCDIYISTGGERFKLVESYLGDSICTEGGNELKEGRSIKLQEDEYVLLGDNRGVSLDSRVFGIVKKNKIIGRVIFRFWPISKIGFVI